jgi:Uma2 family endonuclease
VKEYLRMVEEGILRRDERVELIDGQIVAMSPQGPVHSAVVARIDQILQKLFPAERFCVRIQSTMVAGDDSAPEPDVAVVAGRCEEHERQLPRTAVLVVAVADASLRLDRGRKSELYGRAGVPEYWIVDIADRVVEVRREPSAVGFKLIRILQPEDPVTPLALEGSGGGALRASDLLPVPTT